MSAIADAPNNEAESQGDSTQLVVSNLVLKPASERKRPKPVHKLTLPAIAYMLVLLACVALGALLLRGIAHKIRVRATARPPMPAAVTVTPAAAPAPTALSVPATPPAPAPPQAPASTPSPPTLEVKTVEPAPVAEAQSPPAATPQPEQPDASAAEPAEPAGHENAPLKLQAIFFNPSRPSAIISGRTVFVGGKANEFQVAEIQSGSVTLVSAAQTNILTLK